MASGIPQPLNRFINPLLGTAALENAVLGLILRPPSAAAHIVLAGAVRPPNDPLHSKGHSDAHSEARSEAAGSQRPHQRHRWSGAFLNGMAQFVPDELLPSMAKDDAVSRALWDVAERAVEEWERTQ